MDDVLVWTQRDEALWQPERGKGKTTFPTFPKGHSKGKQGKHLGEQEKGKGNSKGKGGSKGKGTGKGAFNDGKSAFSALRKGSDDTTKGKGKGKTTGKGNNEILPDGSVRSEVRERLELDARSLRDLSWAVRSDKELVLVAVRKYGSVLGRVSMKLRANKEVVLAAVKQHGLALEFASEKLREDRDVVLAAVKQRGTALKDASPRLQADQEVVLAAALQFGPALEFAHETLRADKALMLEVVQWSKSKSGSPLKWASPELKLDRELVLLAVKQDGEAIRFADNSLRGDREIVLAAVKTGFREALQYASSSLQRDKEVVLEAVRKNGDALQYAGEDLKNDEDVVMEAVKTSSRAFSFAGAKVRANREIALLAARSSTHQMDTINLFRRSYMGAIYDLHCSQTRASASGRQAFQEAVLSAIAARGEEGMPVVSVALSPPSPPDEEGMQSLRCEVFLLSGANFQCELADCSSKLPSSTRRLATVNDLAVKILAMLPEHTEVGNATRVFINFLVGDDGDALPATPWDGFRSVTDFVESRGEETQLSEVQALCQKLEGLKR